MHTLIGVKGIRIQQSHFDKYRNQEMSRQYQINKLQHFLGCSQHSNACPNQLQQHDTRFAFKKKKKLHAPNIHIEYCSLHLN